MQMGLFNWIKKVVAALVIAIASNAGHIQGDNSSPECNCRGYISRNCPGNCQKKHCRRTNKGCGRRNNLACTKLCK